MAATLAPDRGGQVVLLFQLWGGIKFSKSAKRTAISQASCPPPDGRSNGEGAHSSPVASLGPDEAHGANLAKVRQVAPLRQMGK